MGCTIECDVCGKKLESVKLEWTAPSRCRVWNGVPAGWGIFEFIGTVIYCSDQCYFKLCAERVLERGRLELEIAEANARRAGVLRDGTP